MYYCLVQFMIKEIQFYLILLVKLPDYGINDRIDSYMLIKYEHHLLMADLKFI